MKKIVAVLAVAVMSVQMAFADHDVVTTDESRLPVAARETIKKNFPDAKISYVKIEKDFFQSANYEATLTNGMEIDFNSKGDWIEVDCKRQAVPAAFIPAPVKEYVETNFPTALIVKIERDRKGYDIEMNNGLDAEFTPTGAFLRLDD